MPLSSKEGAAFRSASTEGAAFLSTLPAQRRDHRAAAAVTALAAAVFVAAAPFAQAPLRPVWAFIPVYEAVLVVNDAITAVLLFGQFAIIGSPALLVLACGYVFTACMAAVHAATFPGLFTPAGLLGAGPQTTAWLYMLWHGGFPLFVTGYALLRDDRLRAGSALVRRRRAMAWGLGATVLLTVLCATLATAGKAWLPPIMAGNHYTPLMLGVVGSAWALSLLALLVLVRQRPYTVLHLWTMVVMVAWLADIALSAVLNAGRFDLGFYTGRLFGMFATGLVLVILLLDNAAIHGRLLAATAELSAANQELDAFSSAVSHDLRAPLRAIRGFSHALEDDHGADLPAPARTYLDEIVKATERMSALVDGLLHLARSTRGGLQRVEVDASSLAEQIRLELERAEPGRGVQWHIEPGLRLQGDARMVQVVLRNLLGNAWKYTSRQPQARIQVQAERAATGPCLCVRDNGAGFDMAQAGSLFQPFRRLHRADEFPGSGIGLATVQRIVRRHGGWITAEAAPGQGATFCFSLGPAAGDGAPAAMEA